MLLIRNVFLVSTGIMAVGFAPGSASAESRAEGEALAVQNRRLLVVPSPCPGPDCTATLREPSLEAKGPRVVFLNFESQLLTRSSQDDNATTNVSAIVQQTMTIPAFSTSVLRSTSGLSRSQIISTVKSQMQSMHSAFDMTFTTTRPSSGSYTMVMFGGTCGSVVGQSGCAGIALGDCGDFLPSNIVFVFPSGLRVGDLSTTAAQEMAHGYGLGHTNDQTDIMYPSIQSYIPTSYGAGNIPDGSGCGGASYQDSHATLLAVIGPKGQDVTAPQVTITAPSNGGLVGDGTIISSIVTDNVGLANVEIYFDADVVANLTSPPFQYTLSGTFSGGDHIVTVRGYDVNGNMGFDRIGVYVSDGTEQSCVNTDECPEGKVCEGNICVPDNGQGGGIGDTCTADAECSTNICAAVGGESRCTLRCDPAATDVCPAGFDCLAGGACWPAGDGGDGGGDGGGGICAAGGDAGSGALSLLLIGLAAAFAGTRRRKQ